LDDTISSGNNNSYDGLPHAASAAINNTTESHVTDPNLARLITAWPTLPQAVKAGIVAMVRASLDECEGQ